MTFKFDNSMLEDGVCTAKALVKHLHGRSGRREKTAADAGTAAHMFYEGFFGGKGIEAAVAGFRKKYAELIGTGDDVEERLGRTNIEMILRRHVEARPYPEEWPFEVVELEKVKGVEIAPGYEFYVKRDMLVRDRATGLLAPLDHKTTGKVTSWWMKKFKMSSQLSGYVWFTQQESNSPGFMAYINAVEFGKLPGSDRRCSTHKCKYSECSKYHAKFELLTVSRTRPMIERWKADAVAIAKKMEVMFQAYPTLEHLPYAAREGAFWDACTFCDYADWCRGGFSPDAVDDYTVVDWWRPWDLSN